MPEAVYSPLQAHETSLQVAFPIVGVILTFVQAEYGEDTGNVIVAELL